jgi:formylmethanofuran dehydrogenase subunit A
MLRHIHPEAIAHTRLSGLTREYSLYEMAIMTRAGPARILGLKHRGHLAPGACADIAVYNPGANLEDMFSRPAYVFKDGVLVVRNGEVRATVRGGTHAVKPEFDRGIEKRLEDYFDRYHTMKMRNFSISNDEMADGIGSNVMTTECAARSTP